MTYKVRRLEDLAADEPYAIVGGPFGSKLTSADYVEEGIPVIRGTNLTGGRYLTESDFVFVTEEKVRQDLFGNLAHPGDIVFTQRGTLGQVAMIPVNAPFKEYVVSQSQMKLSADATKVDTRFIYYWFTSKDTVQKLVSQNASSGVPHINLRVLRKFQIPVPDLHTQKAISDVLASYDNLIENNNKRIGLLEESARLLYREWFVYLRFPGHGQVKIADGIPEAWIRRTYGDVCEAVGGGTPATDNQAFWNDGDIPWYTPTDITRNGCLALLDSDKKITEAGLRNSSAKLLPAGTVLMTSRASVGFFGIIGALACTNQGFISLIPREPLSRMYLMYDLLYRVEEIRSHAGGATYKEINKSKFRALSIIVPNRELLRDFEVQVSAFHAQVRTLHALNKKLAEARELLLPRLMSGEIAA